MKHLFFLFSALLPLIGFANELEVSPMGDVDGEIFILCSDTSKSLLYAYGNYKKADGADAKGRVICWDGSKWKTIGEPFNAEVSVLYIFGGKLYAGGSFTKSGNTQADHIAVWDGSKWSAVGDGFDGQVVALCEYKGKLYAGGIFTKSGTANMPGIAMIEGNQISKVPNFLKSSTAGGQVGGYVLSLKCWKDKLAVLGMGYEPGRMQDPVYFYDGEKCTPVPVSSFGIEYMHVYKDQVYIAGNFMGDKIKNILLFDGKNIDNMMGGVNNNVRGMATVNGKLVCYGDFSSVAGNDTRSWFIAGWDGKKWIPVELFRSTKNPVMAVASFKGKLVIAGSFKGLNKGTVKYICTAEGF